MHVSFKLKNINPVIFFMPASNKESRRQIHSEMFRQTDRRSHVHMKQRGMGGEIILRTGGSLIDKC